MALLNQDDTFHVGVRRTLEFDVTDELDAALDPTSLVFKWTASKINPDTDVFSKTALLEKTSAVTADVDTVEVTGPPAKTYVNVELYTADTIAWSAADYKHQLEAYDGSDEPIMLAEGTLTLLLNMDNA